MRTIATLSFEDAQRLLARAVDASLAAGVAQNVAVVDAVGHLLAFGRMDGANRLSTDIAVNKAVMAAAIGIPTQELAPRTTPGEPGYMIQVQANGRFTTIGGGVPLRSDGIVVGALGISGGSVTDDIAIASTVRLEFEDASGSR